jgi:hypothetical protein
MDAESWKYIRIAEIGANQKLRMCGVLANVTAALVKDLKPPIEAHRRLIAR